MRAGSSLTSAGIRDNNRADLALPRPFAIAPSVGMALRVEGPFAQDPLRLGVRRMPRGRSFLTRRSKRPANVGILRARSARER